MIPLINLLMILKNLLKKIMIKRSIILTITLLTLNSCNMNDYSNLSEGHMQILKHQKEILSFNYIMNKHQPLCQILSL